jgi:hypothetical protein
MGKKRPKCDERCYMCTDIECNSHPINNGDE